VSRQRILRAVGSIRLAISSGMRCSVQTGNGAQGMEFGIFNLMGAREPDKPAAQVFAEVAEQTRLADELGYTIAWFAEHHFSNYCLCASPLMMVAHCASITSKIRLGTAVAVVPLYNPARLVAEIATADALSNGRLMLGIGAGYQPYEFERFGVDIAKNLEMTNEFCDILDLAFSGDFFSYEGKHYRMPKTHIPVRPVQKPIPIYVAGHSQAMFRTAARHGYRVMTSGRVDGTPLLAEQHADIVTAFAAENVPVSSAHITLNRFAHITQSREEGMRFAENARYQTRLASSLRRRKEVMQGTVLVDVPFPDEPSLETICDNLLIGDVETVAEKLVTEIRAAQPVHVCFSFKVGNTPHNAAMRSMELMIGEVKPRVEKALGVEARGKMGGKMGTDHVSSRS
jgi:alkanesulfonate monooxygenase SsuD/methylene tetrahydromethanopterin reductase-like flavin-dependent oxidoreductase (luciferase family)